MFYTTIFNLKYIKLIITARIPVSKRFVLTPIFVLCFEITLNSLITRLLNKLNGTIFDGVRPILNVLDPKRSV